MRFRVIDPKTGKPPVIREIASEKWLPAFYDFPPPYHFGLLEDGKLLLFNHSGDWIRTPATRFDVEIIHDDPTS